MSSKTAIAVRTEVIPLVVRAPQLRPLARLLFRHRSHPDDRRAYIEKWAERGKDPISWYTEKSDKVLRMRDTTGDGVLDDLTEFAEFHDVLSGIGSDVLVDGEYV